MGDTYHRLYRISAQHYRLIKTDGEVMDYQHPRRDTQLLLTRYADINDKALSFRYNANHTLQQITDALGRVTTFDYTTVGTRQINGSTEAIQRVSRITDPFGRRALFGYDAALNLTELTDMANYRSTIGYDTQLNPTQITRPDFGTWQFQVEPNTGEALTGPASDAHLYPHPVPPRAGERVTLTDPNGYN